MNVERVEISNTYASFCRAIRMHFIVLHFVGTNKYIDSRKY